MNRLFVIVVALCALASPALARMIVYTAKNGDTAESIAADYYGNRSLATFISEGNGLGKDAKLKAGQKVRIPTAFHYRVRRGDTLEGLGGKFLDDKRRGVLLAWFNPMKGQDKLREGQDLIIPFQHIHHAEAPESLNSVARNFYGDPNKSKLLMDFNFRTSPMLAKGERVILPIAHVRVRSVHLQQLAAPPPVVASKKVKHEKQPPEETAPTLAAAPDKEAEKREAELAERVSAQLQTAEKSYKEGAYEAVPAQLDKLLAAEDPSEAQLAEIFRLKAFAYVALGMDELAVSSFREVLARKPDLALDEATVSPKIRSALDKARAEAKSSAP
jgi:LysM repeat protein